MQMNNLKLKIKAFFFLIIPLLLLSSCVSRLQISTNTFANAILIPRGFSKNSSFFIYSLSQTNTLFKEEVALKIEKILREKGYKVVSDAQKSNFCLVFDFGIISSTETILSPVYNPGKVINTSGNVYGSVDYVNYHQQTTTSGTISYVPEQVTNFTRNFSVQVYDTKKYIEAQEITKIWEGSAFSVGSSSDLRLVIDYLLISAFKYFGENTNKYIDSVMKANDKEVKRLRNNKKLF